MKSIRLELLAAILFSALVYAALHAWLIEKADQRAHGEGALPSYDCYAYRPQADISAYELARIQTLWFVGLLDPDHMDIQSTVLQSEGLGRHFVFRHAGACE